jgi:methylaspartate ammonia-lyase
MSVLQVIFYLLPGCCQPAKLLTYRPFITSRPASFALKSSIGERKVTMEAKDYCRTVEVELYGWKAKMYDMVRKVDKLRGSEKEKVASRVEELHQHISEMERLIEQLQTECPVDFGPQKKQLEKTGEGLKKKYEDAMAAVFQF